MWSAQSGRGGGPEEQGQIDMEFSSEQIRDLGRWIAEGRYGLTNERTQVFSELARELAELEDFTKEKLGDETTLRLIGNEKILMQNHVEEAQQLQRDLQNTTEAIAKSLESAEAATKNN